MRRPRYPACVRGFVCVRLCQNVVLDDRKAGRKQCPRSVITCDPTLCHNAVSLLVILFVRMVPFSWTFSTCLWSVLSPFCRRADIRIQFDLTFFCHNHCPMPRFESARRRIHAHPGDKWIPNQDTRSPRSKKRKEIPPHNGQWQQAAAMRGG